MYQWASDADDVFFEEMIEATPEGTEGTTIGNSFIVDSGEFDHKVLAEAMSKMTEILDNKLAEIQISIEVGCPITSAFNQLPVTTLKDDKYGFTTEPWQGIRVEYKGELKAGQAILIYENGSKSLLIQEPRTKQWLLLKDINKYVRNYIEGIENATETENKS